MIKNVLVVLLLWVLALFIQSFSNNFLVNFNLDLLGVTGLTILLLSRHRYALLSLLLFGLTSDTWVMLYPGVMTLCYLVIGSLFLRYQNNFNFSDVFSTGILLFSSLLAVKIISFAIILLLAKINLFWQFISFYFWLEILLNVLIGIVIFKSLKRCQNKFKILNY